MPPRVQPNGTRLLTIMVETQRPRQGVRLAEVVASLSLATDLATGSPLEHGLRRALLAVWLGETLGLNSEELSNTYYVALLGTVGCTLEGAALATFVKDEIAVGEQLLAMDPARPLEMAAFLLGKVGEGESPLRRAGKVVSAAITGQTAFQLICRDVALQVGAFLDLGPGIREAVGQCHEQWDGAGGPQRLKGEAISLGARLFLVAHDAEIFNRIGGVEAATRVVSRRAGRRYDPHIAARFCGTAGPLLTRLQTEVAWDAVLSAEPAPVRWLTPEALDNMAQTIANFVDMRSPYTLGHSPRVAGVAKATARALGLSETESSAVRQAGLLHDLGRAGVPVAVWDKRDPLTSTEWERIKKHPSLTELVLARSNALGHLGTLAGLHHERLDGSGYRGVPSSFVSVAARVLAVADAYQTKLEARPHRAALTPEGALAEVNRRARAGQLDDDVVRALVVAAGHQVAPKRRAWPTGLSEREVEVLRLMARGLTNRKMADELVVSPKTVGHHIQHIYDKIGVSTRVGATLFALHYGLVAEDL
jgi:HD-GYP domain-containing protein (c-di-GMP phosphodiesterase class II)